MSITPTRIQARKNRYTWLDPNGGVCTDDERFKFFVATDRWSQREWTYSHAGRLVPSLGCDDKSGRFMVTVRPSVVQTWIARRMCYYASIGVLGGNSAPLQAQLMTSIDQYTRHLSTFLTIDRTPMPFSYVQVPPSRIKYARRCPKSLTPHTRNPRWADDDLDPPPLHI